MPRRATFFTIWPLWTHLRWVPIVMSLGAYQLTGLLDTPLISMEFPCEYLHIETEQRSTHFATLCRIVLRFRWKILLYHRRNPEYYHRSKAILFWTTTHAQTGVSVIFWGALVGAASDEKRNRWSVLHSRGKIFSFMLLLLRYHTSCLAVFCSSFLGLSTISPFWMKNY